MAKKTNAQVKQEVNEALLSDLLSLYTYSEEQMLKKVAKRVAKGATDTGWNEMKLGDTTAMKQEIEHLLKSPGKKAKSIMGKEILKAYKEGVNSAESQKGKPLTAMSGLNVPLSVQNLLLANYNLIDNANSKILRQADDAYREMMAQSAATVLTGVDTRLTASQKMMDRLAAKGITTFTDKAGRTWDMGSYTEMAIRTATAHAALQGQIDTQQSFGMDLMKVSSIGTTCPICARWQGVVLSISGKSGGYHTVDQAKAAGLFHPNCKHTLLMFDPELDGEGQKELNDDKYVASHSKQYDLIQQQRANERMIRYWKRRNAAAITPKAKAKTKAKIDEWAVKNAQHCEKYGLRRNPKREGYHTVNTKDVQFVDWFGKHLMGYSEEDLAKIVLDESTIKALLKNKDESLTSLYKKYLGENPAQDYKDVGESQLTYAQWLKAKVMELSKDIPDPVDEMFAGPSVMTPDELKALKKVKSPTEIYKEKIGPNPSQEYKANYKGNLTYAQWLTGQVNDLAMSKFYSTHSFPQSYAEVSIETAKEGKASSYAAIKVNVDGALENAVIEAIEKSNKIAVSEGYTTKIEDVVNEIKYASPGMTEVMNAKGQGAIVKGGKIYINPTVADKIGANEVLHEIGHLVTKDGLKTSDMTMAQGANEVLKEFEYANFKEMSGKVSAYATKNSAEFFAESYALYTSGEYTKLSPEGQKIVEKAMKVMYGSKATPTTTATATPPPTGGIKIKKIISTTPAKKVSWAEKYASFYDDDIDFSMIENYKAELDGKVTGLYSASQAVKEASALIKTDKHEVYYDLAKMKDLATHEKKAKELMQSSNFEIDSEVHIDKLNAQLKQMEAQGLSEVAEHIKNKVKVWEDAKVEYEKVKTQAVQQAKAAATAQATSRPRTNSGSYKMGFGSLTEKEQGAFIDEFKKSHLSQSSSEGKELSKRLAKKQKEYIKNELGIDLGSNGAATAKALESKIKRGTATPEELALYAMHDYTRASGVYSWYKRGIDRKRMVNIGDHPLGTGMTEWEYGQKMAKHIDSFFEKLPPLEEDVYVHRVFDEDAIASLLGIESEGAKRDVDTNHMLNYAKDNPGETIIRDFSALSTSTFQEGRWNGNCELKLKLNKGVKAAYMGGIEAHDVNETTLKPNTKIRINAVYNRADYSPSEWSKMASEKGFDSSRRTVMFAEALPDDVVQATIEDKINMIDSALRDTLKDKALSKAALRTEVSAESNATMKKWSQKEKDDVKTYTGGSYRRMNTALRTKARDSDNRYNEAIEGAKAALDKASTTEDRVYRRGSDFNALKGMLGEPNLDYHSLREALKNNPEKYNSGTRIVYDDAFISATPDASGGFNEDIEFKIFAPKGTKACYIASLSNYKSELETLFQAGTRFRLLKVREGGSGISGGKGTNSSFTVYLEALTAEDIQI